ncbi:MAG: monofunctional biosynthetic peptidoglycan transglycosylase [Bacteroidetes bacterium]|nr:monofunctional biosynthetic peptidoglycan transglycosylase [Bacteroidota bacterium]MBS1540819.1 monofunctional biosynthetic peptidoglycan transglycosylase [Bacteroidota bacterium]
MRTKFYGWLKKLWKIALILLVAQLVYIFLLRWIDPPITATQLSSWVHGYGLSRDYVSLEDMSPSIRLAVMASEDQLFPDHNGFDVASIKLALKEKNKMRKQMRGASTISQQVAKNVFLWQGRSWLRKGLEVYFTFMIELTWSKRRILEMYLNVSEMGKGIFGIEAASQKYFHKPAKKLSRAEAAMIAACLPSPRKIHVQPPSHYVMQRYPQIMVQMDNLEPDEDVHKLLK